MAENQSKKSKSTSLADYYLILYNGVLTVGWFGILYVTVQTYLTWKTNDDLLRSKGLYKNVEFLLQIFQTAALLEVVHAAIGIVRSNPMLVLFQVLSRIMVVWLITYLFESSRNCLGVFVICLAWSITEIIRYTYYALNILNLIPYLLTWCRYTLFIALYPIGVTGELICIYNAIKYLEPLSIRKKYSYYLPNKLNISFDFYYFLIIVVALYVPIFPMLYMHMFSQRKKVLNPRKDKKTQ